VLLVAAAMTGFKRSLGQRSRSNQTHGNDLCQQHVAIISPQRLGQQSSAVLHLQEDLFRNVGQWSCGLVIGFIEKWEQTINSIKDKIALLLGT